MAEAFASSTDALHFIADRITEQAARDGVPLDEIEQKMLLFSEVEPSLPDFMEVSEAFDRSHSQEDFEAKVTALIRNFEDDARSTEPETHTRWQSAVRTLAPADFYINVMLNSAHTPGIFSPSAATPRPPHDRAKLILTALAICGTLFLLIVFLSNRR